jgi:hypothetical protein
MIPLIGVALGYFFGPKIIEKLDELPRPRLWKYDQMTSWGKRGRMLNLTWFDRDLEIAYWTYPKGGDSQ